MSSTDRALLVPVAKSWRLLGDRVGRLPSRLPSGECHPAMIVYTYFFGGLVLVVLASLVGWGFQEGLTRRFVIVAGTVFTLIVLPIVTVFVLLAMHDLRVHGGFYDFITGPGSPGGPFFGSAFPTGRGW